MSLTREELNNDILIQEIELRPALYNRELKDYFDMSLKQCLWEEIAAKLFRNTWKQMSEDQRENSIREVQKRWKNLRACFTRELRQQKQVETETCRRRTYIYYNNLRFLIPSIEKSSKYGDELEDCQQDDESNIKEDTINIPVQIPTVSRKRKAYERIELASESRSTEDGHKTIQQTEIGSETNFALSLVPMLRRLPINKKIDAQISILQVLKTIIAEDESGSENVVVKTEFDFDD